MDMKKIMDAAMIPAVILSVIGVASAIIGAIPFLNVLLCLLGLPLLIVNIAVLGWAGFRGVKNYGLDLVGGALAGALAGLISAVIGGVVGLVLNLLGMGANVAASGMGGGDLGGAAIGGAVGIVGGIIGLVVGVVFGTIFGAILGAIGAFVAGMNKKN